MMRGGYRSANALMNSQRPSAAKSSTIVCTKLRMRGRRRSTIFGVKAEATRRRSRV